MQVTHSNDFFEGTFGRNDFEYIDEILYRRWHGYSVRHTKQKTIKNAFNVR